MIPFSLDRIFSVVTEIFHDISGWETERGRNLKRKYCNITRNDEGFSIGSSNMASFGTGTD